MAVCLFLLVWDSARVAMVSGCARVAMVCGCARVAMVSGCVTSNAPGRVFFICVLSVCDCGTVGPVCGSFVTSNALDRGLFLPLTGV